VTIYRNLARIVIRATGWGLSAILFATLASQSWGRWAPFLVATTASVSFSALTIRVAQTRIVSDSNGIAVHTMYGRTFHRYSRHDGDLLRVHTPAARLIDGRYIPLTPAGCYRRAKAATIGAQLDTQRRDHLQPGRGSTQPAPPIQIRGTT
jgi:hypothetical protein